MRDLGFTKGTIKRTIDFPYEKVGEVARIPAPSPQHQWVIQRMISEFSKQQKDAFCMLQAPSDLFISEREIRQPDLMLIHKDNESLIHDYGVTFPPDIIIEVLSKSSISLDRKIKFNNYAKFGVKEYWLVDPEKQIIEQYENINHTYQLLQLNEHTEAIRTSALDNITIELKKIFS